MNKQVLKCGHTEKDHEKIKCRGIRTKLDRINEEKPLTTKNRWNQLTISLPRIDDKKRWAGYAGITGISKKIAGIIPNSKIYVEPFAGTVKVFQELRKRDKSFAFAILNDTSDFVCDWLSTNFDDARVSITNEDFADCIKNNDSKDTFFLIDQPWNRSLYDQMYSSFNRVSVAAYDNEVIDLCKKIKGKFIITTRKENERMLKSGFNNMLVKSDYVLSGHYPRVLITTNMKLGDLKSAKR